MRTTLTAIGLVAVCAGGCVAGPPPASSTPALVAIRTTEAPSLDGRADDPAWRDAPAVTVTARGVMPQTGGTATDVTLRAAYSDTHLYLLAVWTDATRDDLGHRTWVWEPGKQVYVEGPDREDMFAVAFEHTGEFVPDMLAGVEAVWDVWHWKAFRTNPQGHAMDKTHRYTNTQPTGSANRHTGNDGRDTWIARPQDAGDSIEVQHPAPTAFAGDRVPRYTAGRPTDSAADVRAKGDWADGRWTLEFARRLTTGHADDTAFDPTRTYRMAVSTHDRSGDMDKASHVVLLRFLR